MTAAAAEIAERSLGSAYAEYLAPIRRYVARLVGEVEAEDVAQETFVKALHAKGGIRDARALRPWLYRVATNLALDRLRSPARSRADATPFDEARLAEDESPLARCPKPSAETRAARSEMSACVRAIVDRLPESQRLPLLLSECEGLRDGEIAEILGATIGSVKIRLHRARARLRKDLDSSCRIYTDSASEVACEPLLPLRGIVRRA